MAVIQGEILSHSDAGTTQGNLVYPSDIQTKATYLNNNKGQVVSVSSGVYKIDEAQVHVWSTAATTGGTATGSGTYIQSSSDQYKTIGYQANQGYHFTGWTVVGGTNCSASGTTLTIGAGSTGGITATANFARDEYAINVQTTGAGSGTVTGPRSYYWSSSPQSLSYMANPSLDSRFDHWSWSRTSGTVDVVIADEYANPASITVTSGASGGTFTLNCEFAQQALDIKFDNFQLANKTYDVTVTV